MATTFDATFDATFRGSGMATINTVTLAQGATTIVQAKATKDEYRDSSVAEKTYTVYYGTVATPVISQTSGQNKFTIACETAEAVIRYTTDGTTPSRTVGSTYSGEVTTTYGLTVKAFAYKELYLDSAAATPVEIVEAGWTTPADITGIESWYDANATDFVVGESNTTWASKTGSGKEFSVANANAPSLSDGAIAFDAASRTYMARADDDLSGEDELTIVIIAQVTGCGANGGWLLDHNMGSGHIFGAHLSATRTALRGRWGNAGASEISVSADNVGNAYRMYVLYRKQSDTSYVKGYRVGYSNTDRTASNTASSSVLSANSIYIGNDNTPGTGEGITGGIKCVVIVRGTIGETDLSNLIDYCETNYGADIIV